MNPFGRIINWILRRIHLDVGGVTNLVISLDTNSDGEISLAELVDAITDAIGRR
jgi:hypothetical protein